MPTLPMADKNVIHSPHIVLLGAGASVAAYSQGDKNGNRLPVMDNLIEVLDLQDILKREDISCTSKNFEELYDDLVFNEKYHSISKDIEERVYHYFSEIEIPDAPTIYDYLILSLRKKDLIASFNWDPLLLQAYRRNIKIKRLPQLVFLHGNVGQGVCYEDKRIGYINTLCEKCMRPLRPVKLLYPIRHKDYSSDLLLRDQWNRLRNHLRIGYWFTMFGYSAPLSDVDAKELMLEVWKRNSTRELAQIEIIDIKSGQELKASWDGFIVRQHYGICRDFFDSYLCEYPRRSCEALAAATLMLNPWRKNEFPKAETLSELHNWVQPLLEEEIKYEKYKEPFKYMTN